MAIMKTYSKEELENLSKLSKNDGYKLLIQPERLNPEARKGSDSLNFMET